MTMQRLSTAQMASFAARGFLRFDGIVPQHINQQFLDDIGEASPQPDSVAGHYGNIMRSSVVPLVEPGTRLTDAYPPGSALSQLLSVPEVAGAIDSLVGLDSMIDQLFHRATGLKKRHPRQPNPHTRTPPSIHARPSTCNCSTFLMRSPPTWAARGSSRAHTSGWSPRLPSAVTRTYVGSSTQCVQRVP